MTVVGLVDLSLALGSSKMKVRFNTGSGVPCEPSPAGRTTWLIFTSIDASLDAATYGPPREMW